MQIRLAPYGGIDDSAESVSLDLDEARLLGEPERDRLGRGFAHPLISGREAGGIERDDDNGPRIHWRAETSYQQSCRERREYPDHTVHTVPALHGASLSRTGLNLQVSGVA